MLFDRHWFRSSSAGFVAALLMAAAFPVCVGAQGLSQLTAPPGGLGRPNGLYGASVAISGDTALVAATRNGRSISARSGIVHVYRLSAGSWNEEAVLVSDTPDSPTQFQFGISVAIEGDLAVVGEFGTGSVYTFTRSGTVWTKVDTLHGPSGFGAILALSGNTLVATSGYSSYVYTRAGNGWTLQQQLVPNPGMQENFGIAVAVSGNILASVSEKIEGFDRRHYVYYYFYNGSIWTNEAKFDLGLAQGGLAGYVLRGAVAISNSTSVAAGVPGTAQVFVRQSGTWTQQAVLDPLSATSGFGASVSLVGDQVAVGSYNDSIPNANSSGTVFLFSRTGTAWTRTARFADPESHAGGGFASAVALSADHLVVGSPAGNSEAYASGRVVVFDVGPAAAAPAVLTEGSARIDERFGSTLARSGNLLIVGAVNHGSAVAGRGGAYLFERSTTGWTSGPILSAESGLDGALAMGTNTVAGTSASQEAVYVFSITPTTATQQARLIGSDPLGTRFGGALAVGSDILFVGQPAYPGSPNPAGVVYVFERTGSMWNQTDRLQPSDSALRDGFGASLALSNNTLAIGSVRTDVGIEQQAGAVYVYVKSGSSWVQQSKLIQAVPIAFSHFGFSVALSGDTLVAGAPSLTGYMPPSEIFVRSGALWSRQAVLTAPPGVVNFGSAVAIQGDFAAVGATDPASAGTVFTYRRSGLTWSSDTTFRANATPQSDPDGFGTALAIEGDEIAISAPTVAPGGAVYYDGNAIFANGFEQ